MLADPIREFCNKNNYELIENYSGSTSLGEMDVLEQLSSFLESKLKAKEIDDSALEELEGTNVDYVDADAIIYFPFIKDYHP